MITMLAILATFVTAPIDGGEGVDGHGWCGTFCEGEVTWSGVNVLRAEVELFKYFEGSGWESIDHWEVYTSGDTYCLACGLLNDEVDNEKFRVVCSLITSGGATQLPRRHDTRFPAGFVFVHPQWFHFYDFSW